LLILIGLSLNEQQSGTENGSGLDSIVSLVTFSLSCSTVTA
jgi:hypothetical protein